MTSQTNGKYNQFPKIRLPDREWPNRIITKAPAWCSVDLRDGNQSLATPMNISQKLEFFRALVGCGFKEIEVGFPSASPTEFAFVRKLIEEDRIPDDVVIQVLTQARKDLIERTVESLKGAKRAIIHLYNSTSPAQRRIVFNKSKSEIVALAKQGVQLIKQALKTQGMDNQANYRLEYSPESFSATEVEFSLEVCLAVMEEWQNVPMYPLILNLPETVQVASPNIYADQIEWFVRNLKGFRDLVTISVHTHNDRGTGVASSELALLAGAERVEGTLFGNGERTGNVDIVTLALNLHSQGVAPGLNLSNLNELREAYERATGMIVPPRHPYAGELVFTAFSGSHQDAIKKGLADWETRGQKGSWEVPYLSIDPRDVGRAYREVIRVNSQSGKGGIAYLLERLGINLPKDMQRDFGPLANDRIDQLAREVSPSELKTMFFEEYVLREEPLSLISFNSQNNGQTDCTALISVRGESEEIRGSGNGPIDAFIHALKGKLALELSILHYTEQSISSGEDASALACVKVKIENVRCWGAGLHTNIGIAAAKAVLSAINRSGLK